jgi:hypothetical protein
MTTRTMHEISQLLGAKFVDLISIIPDEFYYTSPDDRDRTWMEILRAINRGERDPEQLARKYASWVGEVVVHNDD